MIKDNKPGFFYTGNSSMYVQNAVPGNIDQLIKVSYEEFLKRPILGRPRLDTYVKVESVVGEQKDLVLSDEGANIVRMTEPGTAMLCFRDYNGHYHDGVIASILPDPKSEDEMGIWFSQLSQSEFRNLRNNNCYIDHNDKVYHCFDQVQSTVINHEIDNIDFVQ